MTLTKQPKYVLQPTAIGDIIIVLILICEILKNNPDFIFKYT